MNPLPAAQTAHPTVRPRRRWWLRAVIALLALIILGPLGTYFYVNVATGNAWADAEVESDSLDPGWRLENIEADRPKNPDAENCARFGISLGRKSTVCVEGAPNYERIFQNLPPTAQLNTQQLQTLRTELAKISEPLDEARKLKDMPQGQFIDSYADTFQRNWHRDYMSLLRVRDWLKHDAWLLSQEGQTDRAVESCRGLFNSGHSIADEAFLSKFVARVYIQQQAIATLERILAQGEASDDVLGAILTVVARDMKESIWLPILRSRRAQDHYYYTSIRAGKLPSEGLRDWIYTEPVTASNWINHAFPSNLLKYYPDRLRQYNRAVEIAKLPMHERAAKLQELEQEFPGGKKPLLSGSIRMEHEWECQSQGQLRSTLVALCCERYRLKHGHFPASLDRLVQEKLLDSLPADPIDNEPLRYRRAPDFIVIYSIGIDGKDDQGNIDREKEGRNPAGIDIGFRVWNASHRRQAPLPPVALPAVGKITAKR